jgi:hypothetical protein
MTPAPGYKYVSVSLIVSATVMINAFSDVSKVRNVGVGNLRVRERERERYIFFNLHALLCHCHLYTRAYTIDTVKWQYWYNRQTSESTWDDPFGSGGFLIFIAFVARPPRHLVVTDDTRARFPLNLITRVRGEIAKFRYSSLCQHFSRY